jgi:membrane protein DedA with SNARE-associated domain
VEPLGLTAIAALLFVKEVGLPVPIPGDLVVLGAGIAAARGELPPLPALVAIVLAGIVGGVVQFLLIRSVARDPMMRLLGQVGLGPGRAERLAGRMRAGGARAVAIGRMTPGLRIGVIVASGLAGLPYLSFVSGLAAGNSVFVGGHFALGYLAGEPALRLAGALSGPAIVVAIAALAAVGAAGWLVLRRVKGRDHALGASNEPKHGVGGEALAWADAACPACLALAIATRPSSG